MDSRKLRCKIYPIYLQLQWYCMFGAEFEHYSIIQVYIPEGSAIGFFSWKSYFPLLLPSAVFTDR